MYSRFGQTLGGGLGYMRGTSAAGLVGVSNGLTEVLEMAYSVMFVLQLPLSIDTILCTSDRALFSERRFIIPHGCS
jgi:hypothetical protein